MKATNITDLTDAQKQVLTKIAKSPTPTVAVSEISEGRKLVAARDMLERLGLISFDQNSAEITEQGRELMRDLNLIDAADELTDEGTKYASADEEVPENPGVPANEPTDSEEPMPESVQFKFLYSIHKHSQHEDDDML